MNSLKTSKLSYRAVFASLAVIVSIALEHWLKAKAQNSGNAQLNEQFRGALNWSAGAASETGGIIY